MLDHEKRTFAEIYRGVCANYGREASKDAMRMTWSALAPFSVEQVRQAYQACVMTSRFMPTIAEILDMINAGNPAMRRPGPDEAWARMPRSEDDSVVWTEEMAYAWSVASTQVNPCLVEKPDWMAARMAFKDAYQRAVDTARAQGKPVRWDVARGQRNDNLEDVLAEALRLGYITTAQAQPHVLELEHARPVTMQRLLVGSTREPEAVRDAALAAVAKLKTLLQAPAAPNYDIDAVRAECEAMDNEREQQNRKDAA